MVEMSSYASIKPVKYCIKHKDHELYVKMRHSELGGFDIEDHIELCTQFASITYASKIIAGQLANYIDPKLNAEDFRLYPVDISLAYPLKYVH